MSSLESLAEGEVGTSVGQADQPSDRLGARLLEDPRDVAGIVLAAQANFYRVALTKMGGPSLLCTCRSRLKKLGRQVVVGDRVTVSLSLNVRMAIAQHAQGEFNSDWRGVIETVADRQTFLPRPVIANVQQVLVVCALADPEPDPVYLTRLLVQVEACGLQPQVCLSKQDLVSAAAQAEWAAYFRAWGYQPYLFSVETGAGLAAVGQLCAGQVSVVAGASGAGKSSLLNALVPGLALKTQAVSGRLRHGRHTTRHVELFPLPGGGWIADTPGFNQLDLTTCQPQTLIQHFPEARAAAAHCQFADCLHQEEPGCQVRALPWDRYALYRQCLEEIIAQAAIAHASSADNPEHQLPTRYRRLSRRTEKQEVQAMLQDTRLGLDEDEIDDDLRV